MSFTSALVLFLVIWAVVFYMINPLWQVSQSEDGNVVPGTPEGAPVDPMLKKKAVWTTLWAAVVFTGAYALVEIPLVTLQEVSWFTMPSER